MTVLAGIPSLVATSLDGRSKTCHIPRVIEVFRDDTEKLVRPLIHHYNKLSYGSQCNLGHQLERLAMRSRGLCAGLPADADEWQQYLIALFKVWFEQNESSLATRIRTWQQIAFWFTLLRDSRRVIPPGVDIPFDDNNRVRLDDEPAPRLLGEAPIRAVGDRHQKVLVDISLVRSDPEYMDEIRSTLSRRRAELEVAACCWVDMIDTHFRYGQRLMSLIDYETELRPHLDDPGFWRDWDNNGAHKANGRSEQSLGVLLGLLRHSGNVRKALFEGSESDFLPSYPTLGFPVTAPSVVSPKITKSQRIRWMLGVLTPMDYSYAHLFLTLHHPIFFGSAFYDAKIISRQGERLVALGDSSATVSLLKNRAHAMKYAELDEPSVKCLSMLIDMTAEVRERRQKTDPAASNRLVLIERPEYVNTTRILREGGAWIGNYFPSVAKEFAGTTINMRKVRATEGVLEWLRTGSLLAATRRLGNSKQIFIEHYLPGELLASFYARQIRRYHILFLATATPPDISLSEVLEFKSIDEIHDFIESNLKIEPFRSSPLGKALKDKVSSSNKITANESSDELILPVSENAMAALFLYQECAMEVGFNNSTISEHVARRLRGITPDDLISLAELARFRLPEDRDPRMRDAHVKGLKRCRELKKTYQWRDLMMRAKKQ
ncbi:hypothetical protein [Paraburkholderia nodosa]|uniref:hypothetical protein n=1 Tax=Paraburkholderia nodosa TaxID=392320 RepID=UPI000841B1BE|nr:hypothetical protein [Paraburkholderia nodosa]